MVADCSNYSVKQRAESYARYHKQRGKKGIAYHFFIPYCENDPYIYVTMYLDGVTWNASNYILNLKNIAILLDGHLVKQKPTNTQLRKLKQLLDDIDSNWFSKNGWVKFDVNIHPKKYQRTVGVSKTATGFTKVYPLNYHSEVVQPCETCPTACPGKYAIPYVKEYRIKQGNVHWGDVVTPPTCEDKLKEANKKIEQLETTIEQKNATIKELEKTIRRHEVRISELENSLKKMQSRYDKLMNEHMHLYADYKKLQRDTAHYKAVVDFIAKIINYLTSWARAKNKRKK